MSEQVLIVIQGGSATGKSTLARKLSTDLGIYTLTKDNFKEMMYDVLGTPASRDESTLYGLAATKALYAAAETLLASGKSVTIESAFHKELALDDIHRLIGDRSIHLMQIYVTAPPALRLQRYEDRIRNGERHPSHPDGIGMWKHEDLAADEVKFGKLNIDDTVEIDTNDFDDSDYAKFLASMKTMIGDIK